MLCHRFAGSEIGHCQVSPEASLAYHLVLSKLALANFPDVWRLVLRMNVTGSEGHGVRSWSWIFGGWVRIMNRVKKIGQLRVTVTVRLSIQRVEWIECS